MRAAIRSAFRSAIRTAFRGAEAVLARLIPQFNGTDNYATLNTPAVMATSDTLEFQFASLNAGVLDEAFDGVIQFDALELLQLTNCTATFDATPVADGASISAYLDGAVYTVILTFTGADTITYVGKSGVLTNYLQGHILSFTTTISSVETEYVLDTKTPTGITYTNFADVDWHNYKYDSALSRWDYQGSGIAGSQLMQFEGTATTPLSSSIQVTGSTWEMNWEGLWVEHYASGVGAYTYLAAPDGVPMRLDIHDPASVTLLYTRNEQMTGTMQDISGFTILSQYLCNSNKLTGAISSISSNTALIHLWCYSNQLTEYTSSVIASTLTNFRAQDNALTVDAVDRILSDIAASVALATRIGNLFLEGGTNGVPTGGAANVNVAYLQSQGWTVVHN